MNEIVVLCETKANEEIIKFGVDKDWLVKYITINCEDNGHTMSLEKFMETYTSDDSVEVFANAILANKAAFCHDPDESPALYIVGQYAPWKAYAMLDYISQTLQEAGYGEASKYFDATFNM